MNLHRRAFLAAGAGALVMPVAAEGKSAAQIEITGANCFDGEKFIRRDLRIANGRFTDSEFRAGTTERVDLTGRWIVSPFADAHSHSFGEGQPSRERERAASYVRDGVFYVMSQGNLPLSANDQAAMGINTASGPDVAFANGMVIPPDGPVRGFYEAIVFPSGAFPGRTFASLADSRYFEVPDIATLNEKWPLIRAQRSDFVKVYLHNTERDASISFAPFFKGTGVSRAVLYQLVIKAHSVGLRVSAHVSSAGDIIAALEAKVDMLAHVTDGPITAAVAARVAAAGIPTATTMAFRARVMPPPAKAIVENNLRLLREAGANLVIGADTPPDSSVNEVAYLAATKLWSNAELLRMWTISTPKAIYPSRRLGFSPGDEASFLVLSQDPLANWQATRTIERRIKKGVWLS
jgi:imidazolonepropionase-like amidohydrolase